MRRQQDYAILPARAGRSSMGGMALLRERWSHGRQPDTACRTAACILASCAPQASHSARSLPHWRSPPACPWCDSSGTAARAQGSSAGLIASVAPEAHPCQACQRACRASARLRRGTGPCCWQQDSHTSPDMGMTSRFVLRDCCDSVQAKAEEAMQDISLQVLLQRCEARARLALWGVADRKGLAYRKAPVSSLQGQILKLRETE